MKMLEAYYDSKKMQEILLPVAEYHPFPKCGEEHTLTEAQKAEMIQEGEKYLGYRWPVLPVCDYMAYKTKGSRVIYEDPRRERRAVLAKLMDAEFAEGKGRFLEDMVNVMWAILEEMTWVVPAHNEVWGIKYNRWGKFVTPGENVTELLPDPDGVVLLDLFSASTAGLLSGMYYRFEKELNAITPVLARQIEKKVTERVLDPFLENYYWWSGLEQPANNWNPWILSNVLTAAAFVCKDEEKRARIVARACFLLEHFLESYHADGGCDEGPSYWGAAGASLYDCLTILSGLTGGAFDGVFRDPLVQNIARYIYRAHIGGMYFTNYADAPLKMRTSPNLIYRFGKKIGDAEMCKFAAGLQMRYLEADGERPMEIAIEQYYRHLENLETAEELKCAEAELPLLESVYLDGIQVIAERQTAGSEKGLYLSAKGGHNNESHNHNDIGNFLLYVNGEPVLVDIGSGVYNSRTFGKHRYENIHMQSSYHNVPEINGVAQKEGLQYRAEQVCYAKENGTSIFTMDISAAYPKEAGVSCWNRKFVFDRANRQIILNDSAAFSAEMNEVVWTFITPEEPLLEEHAVVFAPNRSHALRMAYEGSPKVTVERVDMTHDAGLLRSWGDAIYRVQLTETCGKAIERNFRFTEE